ncbi:hypothetical protein TNCV_3273501 [Trichonephila clavipes]|nr:hypothetical protein TNCV_3273501 [Trichonephila clavipes]
MEGAVLNNGIGGRDYDDAVIATEDIDNRSWIRVDEHDMQITETVVVFGIRLAEHKGFRYCKDSDGGIRLNESDCEESEESADAKKTSFLRASTHHRVQQVRQCAGQLTTVRHGAYLEYTQDIALQHQGDAPTGKPFICSTSSIAMSPKRFIPSQERAHSCLPSTACQRKHAKVIPRTPFASLQDAIYGKHADWQLID